MLALELARDSESFSPGRDGTSDEDHAGHINTSPDDGIQKQLALKAKVRIELFQEQTYLSPIDGNVSIF